jgi:hypothetical protein
MKISASRTSLGRHLRPPGPGMLAHTSIQARPRGAPTAATGTKQTNERPKGRAAQTLQGLSLNLWRCVEV